MTAPIICTIIAKNYLAQARCLAASFLKHHPTGRMYVLLVDTVGNYFDPAREPFELITVDQLSITALPEMKLRYNVRELATAVKPYFLEYLFKQRGIDRVCYFDPDIRLYDSIQPLWEKLATHAAVLTPHILGPLDEEHLPNEFSILQAGTYNLGFLGLRQNPQTMNFLHWWQERLIKYSHGRPQQWQHFDQKWVDLLPGFVDDVAIERSAGYNAAYWDVSSRHLTHNGTNYLVNGTPLVFWHFSGYDPAHPHIISRHQNRFSFAGLPVLQQLFNQYRQELMHFGHETISQWPNQLINASADGKIKPLQHRWQRKKLQFSEQLSGLGPTVYRFVTQRLAQWGLEIPLTRLLGEANINRLRSLVLKIRLPQRQKKYAAKPFGVNVMGYFDYRNGVGEVARHVITALHQHRVPVAWELAEQTGMMSDLPADIPPGHPYAVNLLHINADVLADKFIEHRQVFDAAAYSIGWWWWELQQFPQRWRSHFRYIDEIWVGSSYIKSTLAPLTDVPIQVMGVPLEPRQPIILPRQTFGLSERKIIFLFIFDLQSYIDRKNPQAVIAAYRQAFGPHFAHTQLVIKVSHAAQFPEQVAQLREALASVQGVLIDSMLDRQRLDALFQMADAYVSLHRAEGFGLTLTEAMSLAKPVIATNYSGNTDYMHEGNSYPIQYHLVPIKKTVGPYEAGSLWAEPDIDHAAFAMQQVVTDREEATYKGVVAAQEIANRYNYQRVASRMAKRLREVSR